MWPKLGGSFLSPGVDWMDWRLGLLEQNPANWEGCLKTLTTDSPEFWCLEVWHQVVSRKNLFHTSLLAFSCQLSTLLGFQTSHSNLCLHVSVSHGAFSRGCQPLDLGPVLIHCDLITRPYVHVRSHSIVAGGPEFWETRLFTPVHWVKLFLKSIGHELWHVGS